MIKHTSATSQTIRKKRKPLTAPALSQNTSINNDKIVSRVRQLAWTGQHSIAIDLIAQALASGADWKPSVQMDLLDLHMRSCHAQGKSVGSVGQSCGYICRARDPRYRAKDDPIRRRSVENGCSSLRAVRSNLTNVEKAPGVRANAVGEAFEGGIKVSIDRRGLVWLAFHYFQKRCDS